MNINIVAITRHGLHSYHPLALQIKVQPNKYKALRQKNSCDCLNCFLDVDCKINVFNFISQVIDEMIDFHNTSSIPGRLLSIMGLLHESRLPLVDALVHFILAVVDLEKVEVMRRCHSIHDCILINQQLIKSRRQTQFED